MFDLRCLALLSVCNWNLYMRGELHEINTKKSQKKTTQLIFFAFCNKNNLARNIKKQV